MANARSFASQRTAHRVEDPVDETNRIVIAEGARQLERFVDDHLRRRSGLVQKFVDRQPQDQPIEDVLPLDPPVLRRFHDHRIDLGRPAGDAARQLRGEAAQLVAERFGRRRPRPERLADFEHRHFAHFPLVEHLHGDLAPAMPGFLLGSFRRPPLRAGIHPPISSSMLRKSFAISSAAAAASRPLFPAPAPERSTACSSVSVVSTPKAIGTPGAEAARAMPCVAASAMYSKCIVSPLMRQPRQTTASNSPLSPRRWAVIGISKAPGTRITVSASGGTSASAKNCCAPRSSPSVISSLKRATTIAKRNTTRL